MSRLPIDPADIDAGRALHRADVISSNRGEVASPRSGTPSSRSLPVGGLNPRGDKAGPAHAWFVENVSASKYNRVGGPRDVGAAAEEEATGAESAASSSGRAGAPLRALAADNLIASAESLFFGAQGMLAGVCLFSSIQIHSFANPSNIISSYAALAAIIQRLTYVLATLALMGAGHVVVRRRGKRIVWLRTPTSERVRLWFVVVLYALGLLLTLLGMRIDDFISARRATAEESSLTDWRNLMYTRAVCFLLAWLLVVSDPQKTRGSSLAGATPHPTSGSAAHPNADAAKAAEQEDD